jgi:hypothetical protein
MYHELWPGYIDGLPSCLMSNEKNTYEPFKCYQKHGKLANVKEEPELVAKDCSKEALANFNQRLFHPDISRANCILWDHSCSNP